MKRDLYLVGGSFLLLLALFLGLDPNKLPSFLLILPFILIFGFLFALVAFLLQKYGMGRAKSLRVGLLCASIPTLLLVLQSIGQLTVRDVLTLAVLFILAFFYITKTVPSS